MMILSVNGVKANRIWKMTNLEENLHSSVQSYPTHMIFLSYGHTYIYTSRTREVIQLEKQKSRLKLPTYYLGLHIVPDEISAPDEHYIALLVF